MGTRSRIACRQTDGTIRSIYCHWDGYLDGVGQTLLKHYRDLDTLTRLLDRGDRSTLEDSPEEGMAYLDRGEDCPALVSETREELSGIEMGEEYLYLYEPASNEWFVRETRSEADWFKLFEVSE